MAPLGHRLFARLGVITAQRSANAERYRKLLPWGPKLKAIVPRSEAVPAYLRYPVLVAEEYRDKVLTTLRDQGIGATASYPTAISEIPELLGALRPEDRKVPGGRDLARRVLTLPTHGYVTVQDQDRIVEVIMDVLGA
jgi:UDP-2-acetamido-2-deoxy-ribo-hexuluronate aminotransferase